MDASAVARLREIGTFLRRQRLRSVARLAAPVPGRRRHVTYLTQAEVAEMADVSESLVAQVEAGRYLHLTPQLVTKLATALGLDVVQLRYLHNLLAESAACPESASTNDGLIAAARAIVEAVTLHPAMLIGPRLDYLAWNRSAVATLIDFATLSPEDRNCVWVLFCRDEMRRNWLH